MYYEDPEINDDRQYNQYCQDNNGKCTIERLEEIALRISRTNFIYAIPLDGCPKYLTPRKRYKIMNKGKYDGYSFLFEIIDDEGDKLRCFSKNCFHSGIKGWAFE